MHSPSPRRKAEHVQVQRSRKPSKWHLESDSLCEHLTSFQFSFFLSDPWAEMQLFSKFLISILKALNDSCGGQVTPVNGHRDRDWTVEQVDVIWRDRGRQEWY